MQQLGLNATSQSQYFGVVPISHSRRLGGLLLEIVLFWLTLGIGWFVWSCLLLVRAQSPSKQILDHVIVDVVTGRKVQWWRAGLRQFIPAAIAIYSFFGPLYYFTYTHGALNELIVPIGGTAVLALLLIVDGLFMFTSKRRRLFDFIFNTTIVAGRDIKY